MSAVRLGELLASPDLRSLTQLAGDPQRLVTSVRVVGGLADLRAVVQDGLAIVLPAASNQARGHLFDIALRDAAGAGASAIILTGIDPNSIEPTAHRIASRGALALLVAPPAAEPTLLAIAVWRVLTGGATEALARIDAARRQVAAAESAAQNRGAAILAAAADALGTPIQARQPADAEPAAPVVVEGIVENFITAEVPTQARGAWAIAACVVVRLAADAYARVIAEERRTELAPIRDRGRLLGELLLAPESERVPLVSRARTLGLAVDGWHHVLRFELSSSLNEPATAVTADQIDAVGRAVLDAVRVDGDDRWHSTRIGNDPLLVRSVTTEPGPAAARIAHRAATTALAAARERFPGLIVRCGIGGVHRRAEGLRTSATDARAALAVSRQSQPPRDVVAIDALGLNRMLVEWYASDTTRASVDDLLGPLVELGHGPAEEAIRTLQAYLDHQNSPARAAKVLRVHPQTINYRLRKISGLLGVDPADAEQRLALQLACRAWLMR